MWSPQPFPILAVTSDFSQAGSAVPAPLLLLPGCNAVQRGGLQPTGACAAALWHFPAPPRPQNQNYAPIGCAWLRAASPGCRAVQLGVLRCQGRVLPPLDRPTATPLRSFRTGVAKCCAPKTRYKNRQRSASCGVAADVRAHVKYTIFRTLTGVCGGGRWS